MRQEGEVVMNDAATGRFGVPVRGGGYLAAENLNARPMPACTRLAGSTNTIGTETFAEPDTGSGYCVILAYGLSRDAVKQESA